MYGFCQGRKADFRSNGQGWMSLLHVVLDSALGSHS